MASVPLHARHERLFQDNRYVYPVLSRRAGGLSLGVNLNPNKACNFNCIYCQVDRTAAAPVRRVQVDRLLEELDRTLDLVASGRIYRTERFRQVPPALRRLNDIAFSGDGEPTSYRNFAEVIQSCAEIKAGRGLNEVKMILITNASLLDRSQVQRGLAILDRNQGEIWAKLDAGTENYFRRISRTTVEFQRILDNITGAARVRPIVIQSLFMNIGGQPPPEAELAAYCQRLRQITASGGRLRLVQVYTIARRPADPSVTALAAGQLRDIAQRVQRETGIPAVAF